MPQIPYFFISLLQYSEDYSSHSILRIHIAMCHLTELCSWSCSWLWLWSCSWLDFVWVAKSGNLSLLTSRSNSDQLPFSPKTGKTRLQRNFYAASPTASYSHVGSVRAVFASLCTESNHRHYGSSLGLSSRISTRVERFRQCSNRISSWVEFSKVLCLILELCSFPCAHNFYPFFARWFSPRVTPRGPYGCGEFPGIRLRFLGW